MEAPGVEAAYRMNVAVGTIYSGEKKLYRFIIRIYDILMLILW